MPWRTALTIGLAFWLVGGFLFWVSGSLAFGLAAGLIVGLVVALIFIVGLGLESGDPLRVAHPGDLWRGDIAFRVTFALMLGLVAGLMLGLAFGLEFGLGKGLGLGLAGGLALGLATGLTVTEAWRTAISQTYLAIRYRTPLRLGCFLKDAHARHLLRAVGPVYQFRHATLQDRLAPPS